MCLYELVSVYIQSLSDSPASPTFRRLAPLPAFHYHLPLQSVKGFFIVFFSGFLNFQRYFFSAHRHTHSLARRGKNRDILLEPQADGVYGWAHGVRKIFKQISTAKRGKNQLFIKPSIFKTSHCATATVWTFLETSGHESSLTHFKFEDI